MRQKCNRHRVHNYILAYWGRRDARSSTPTHRSRQCPRFLQSAVRIEQFRADQADILCRARCFNQGVNGSWLEFGVVVQEQDIVSLGLRDRSVGMLEKTEILGRLE